MSNIIQQQAFSSNPQFPSGATAGYISTCSDTSGNWIWAPADAPTNALYLVGTESGTLTDEINIGALASGLLLSTVSAGVSTISILAPSTLATLAGTQTFAGTNTFSVAPVMSGASISSATIPVASVVGTAASLAATQTFAGTNTFSVAPVMSGASIGSATIPVASVVGVAASLAATQTFAGTNTFSTAPVMSGASISSGTVPVASVVGVAASLAATQAFAGTNTFSVAPIMSGASISSATIPVTSVVGTAGALSGANVWTSTNSFNTALPTSTVTPVGSTDLITKAYGDGTYALTSSSAAIATVQTLDTTVTPIITHGCPSNGVITIQGWINAADASYADATYGDFSICVASVSGSLTIIGQKVEVSTTSSATFSVGKSGSNIVVSVTGLSADTYNWNAYYYVYTN